MKNRLKKTNITCENPKFRFGTGHPVKNIDIKSCIFNHLIGGSMVLALSVPLMDFCD